VIENCTYVFVNSSEKTYKKVIEKRISII
jgi:hypothetical protein